MKAVISLTQRLVLAGLAAWLFLLGGSAAAEGNEEDNSQSGAVYVLTNLAQGNTVVAFHRSADGTLTRTEEVATGGLGSGPGELPPGFGNGPGPNPLDSQDMEIQFTTRVFKEGRQYVAHTRNWMFRHVAARRKKP